MIYLFIGFFAFLILFICFVRERQAPYEAEGRGKAVLLKPAKDHAGPLITTISMMKSLGGKGADWELYHFPLRGIALQIGLGLDGKYSLLNTGLCHVYLNGEPCEISKKIILNDKDLIEICLEDDDRVWSLEYRRRYV